MTKPSKQQRAFIQLAALVGEKIAFGRYGHPTSYALRRARLWEANYELTYSAREERNAATSRSRSSSGTSDGCVHARSGVVARCARGTPVMRRQH